MITHNFSFFLPYYVECSRWCGYSYSLARKQWRSLNLTYLIEAKERHKTFNFFNKGYYRNKIYIKKFFFLIHVKPPFEGTDLKKAAQRECVATCNAYFFSTATFLYPSLPTSQPFYPLLPPGYFIAVLFSLIWISESSGLLHFLLRHLAVTMNSLVATPPVPPHFYENSRFSPSRMSKISLPRTLE